MKRALITGATSGIGLATAEMLLAEGYEVMLVGRRLERLEKIQKKNKKKVQIAKLDVTSHKSVAKFFAEEKKYLSKCDVLINCAGLAKGKESFQNANVEDWETMIDTNIKGLLYFSRLMLPFFIENSGGHIVNLGSVAGRYVYPGGSIYCATKFAVRAISEGLRMDLLGTGIRISNVEPGMVNTEFSKVRMGSQEEADRVYKGMTPLTADDIAESVLWCLSRPARVNIQEMVIYPTDQASVYHVHRK